MEKRKRKHFRNEILTKSFSYLNFQDGGSEQVECRHDWHQTATHVTVAIYGKKYDPDSSYIEVNPIRMKCHIVFPEQGGSFDMDIELRGVSLMIFQHVIIFFFNFRILDPLKSVN